MAKFKVVVKFHPDPLEYEVEIDAVNEKEAALIACSRGMYNEHTADEAPDCKNGTFSYETEQLTFDCEECGAAIETREKWIEQGTRCAKCCAAYMAEPEQLAENKT